jgi:predicted nucleic acid-binding protein
MIDSSLLVEFSKGGRKNLLLSLIGNTDNECCINETIISEYLYYYLALKGGTSPMSLKSSERINEVMIQSEDYSLIKNFSLLPVNNSIFSLVPLYMQQYNLLPNDAIILATCKIHNITQLASHDKDFEEACKSEGIELLTE